MPKKVLAFSQGGILVITPLHTGDHKYRVVWNNWLVIADYPKSEIQIPAVQQVMSVGGTWKIDFPLGFPAEYARELLTHLDVIAAEESDGSSPFATPVLEIYQLKHSLKLMMLESHPNGLFRLDMLLQFSGNTTLKLAVETEWGYGVSVEQRDMGSKYHLVSSNLIPSMAQRMVIELFQARYPQCPLAEERVMRVVAKV